MQRRDFLKTGLASAMGISLASCVNTPFDPSADYRGSPRYARTPAGFRTYNAGWAVRYAKENWNRPYGSGSDNPFGNFYDFNPGGNCTNFVSQCLLAGFVASTSSAKSVFDARLDYLADQGSPYAWYYIDKGKPEDLRRGPAWAGVRELRRYADINRPEYKGLHFQFITNDTPTKFMDYSLVKPGDIIFMDIGGDGPVDHGMIVTDYDVLRRGYNKIRLTYQTNNMTNKGLGDLNEEKKYKALFYVYRPLNYNPSGK